MIFWVNYKNWPHFFVSFNDAFAIPIPTAMQQITMKVAMAKIQKSAVVKVVPVLIL